MVRAKLGPSVLMTREAGKLSLWWLAPILASIRWSLGSPATCAHYCSLKILKRLARFSNTILSCQLSSDEQHDATYQLKLFYKFCELDSSFDMKSYHIVFHHMKETPFLPY